MNTRSRFRWPSLAAALAGLLLAAGCGPPDRWGLFAQTPAPPPPGATRAPVPIPYTAAPEPAGPSLPELPPAGPLELTVEEAVLFALRNNRDLKVARLNPVAAGSFELIERGRFDPELFAELEYQEERSTETARSTGTQFSVTGDDRFAAAGLRQELPTGTALELSVEQARTSSNRAPEQQTARVGLSVTQALLRGFGPSVNLVEVRQAELETLASRYELQGFTEALLAEAETAYWKFVLANEEIAIFESSLAVSRKELEEIELRIEVGILPPIEAAAARAEVALREQALINASSRLEERRLRLLRLIDPAGEGSFERRLLAASDPRMDPEPLADLDDRVQLAVQARPDLNEARLRLQQNRLETIRTRNGLLPRLDLFVALGRTGYADTFPDSFRELDGNTYDLTAGLRLSRFLGNRAAEGRDLAARTGRAQAAEAVGNLGQIVRLDVRLAANELERTRRQIAASRATRIFQEQTLQAEEERFDVGSSTSLQVSQARRDLLVGRIAEVEAIVNYRIALVDLYLAEGSLLERRGIVLPEPEPGF